MKTKHLFLAAAIAGIAFASCSKDNNGPRMEGDTEEVYIDASSSSTWHYYSFSQGKVVGSAEESAENNAAWGARTDWDMAVQKRYIRTNSGEFTTVGARGGIYTFDAGNFDEVGNIAVTTTFASVKNLSGSETFAVDKSITETGMSGDVTLIRSEAITVQLKKKADGTGSVMPPVYLKAPVYIFRTADGGNYYKVDFIQYKSDENVAGHLIFNVAQIY